ncbi:hypothetical protein [Streptomyces sp. NPDC050485]|uniref:hypothetical protein n=1 Tax=Streptomyces sp. NPDC050485 TaxID=3365617 RepID=UPI00379D8F3C
MQELSDWGSSLLAVDGYIAGYAIRVESGSLDPREISDIDPLVLEVESLRRSLEDIRPQTREYIAPLEEFRCYIVALEALIHALALLADESGESTMG